MMYKRLTAALLSGVMAAGMVVAPAQAAPAPADLSLGVSAQVAHKTITGGEFTWGFRKSLVTYIYSIIARGTVETTGGATATKNGFTYDFHFPIDTQRVTYQENGDATIPLQGKVHFLGHKDHKNNRWALDVEFSDLTLKVKGTQVTLQGDYVTKGDIKGAGASDTGDYSTVSGDDVPLTSFNIPHALVPNEKGGYQFLQNDSAVVASGFRAAFLNKYDEGSALDAPDLTIRMGDKGELERAGHKMSMDNENRTKIIVGSVFGILAFLGAVAVFFRNIMQNFRW